MLSMSQLQEENRESTLRSNLPGHFLHGLPRVRHGQAQEKVFDVVWSDMARRVATSGKVPAVGDTVNTATATYTTTIGAPSLSTVWTDPLRETSRAESLGLSSSVILARGEYDSCHGHYVS